MNTKYKVGDIICERCSPKKAVIRFIHTDESGVVYRGELFKRTGHSFDGELEYRDQLDTIPEGYGWNFWDWSIKEKLGEENKNVSDFIKVINVS